MHGDWVVVRACDAAEYEERRPFPLSAAQLRVWSKDAFYSRVLLEIARTLWGGVEHRRAHEDRWNKLLPRLEDAFRRGTLLLVKQRRQWSPWAGGSGGADAEEDSYRDQRKAASSISATPRYQKTSSSSSETPRKPKTWVAIRLMDQDGQPLAGEAYRLVTPDGTVQEGSLDETGEAFVNGIDPGECQISFPKLDGKEWKQA